MIPKYLNKYESIKETGRGKTSLLKALRTLIPGGRALALYTAEMSPKYRETFYACMLIKHKQWNLVRERFASTDLTTAWISNAKNTVLFLQAEQAVHKKTSASLSSALSNGLAVWHPFFRQKDWNKMAAQDLPANTLLRWSLIRTSSSAHTTPTTKTLCFSPQKLMATNHKCLNPSG